MRRQGEGAGLDPESLLRIPLARHLFGDSGVAIVVRGVDARWWYSDVVGAKLAGFNPFAGAVLAGRHSNLADWLPHRAESARPWNRQDRLVVELLFALHDYLHVWSYRWIGRLWPELGFGSAPITRANFEDMVFCHLLSEAVATVGLDYWYLACTDLNAVASIGTARKGLAASYRVADEEEYRRFHPEFAVQRPQFFAELARFYCDGVFHGFSAEDIAMSPLLGNWLGHELRYGELQRRYCREWFAHLSGGAVRCTDAALSAPVRGSRRRQRRVMGEIGELLWAKIKHDEPGECDFRFDPAAAWRVPAEGPRAYQFVNLNRCEWPQGEEATALSNTSLRYLLHQFIAGFDHTAFPDEARPLLSLMYRERDFAIGRRLLGDVPRAPVAADEPLSMFFYN